MGIVTRKVKYFSTPALLKASCKEIGKCYHSARSNVNPVLRSLGVSAGNFGKEH